MRSAGIGEVQEQLDFFFLNLRDRWQIGLDIFKEQIDSFCDDKIRKYLKPRDIINTPIHNIISLEGSHIFLLLDSIFMQRLRGIHHQGLGYLVYPTATHSRFEHSLGTYKLINDIMESANKRENSNFKKCEFSKTELNIAALLHDIGHYAYSHIGETIFEDFINRNKIRFPNINTIFPENHEIRSADILCGEDLFSDLKKYYRCIINPEDFFERIFKKLDSLLPDRVKLENICDLISKLKRENEDVGHLINGPLDVDKLDYILREAYFTGTPFGNIDIYRIIKGYAIGRIRKKTRIKNQLVFNKRMVPSILQMYVGREFNYLQISHHRTLRIAETTLKCVFDIVMNTYLKELDSIEKDEMIIEERLCKVLLHFKLMEDRDFLHFMEIMTNLSPVAKKLFNRLLTRTLYKGCGYHPSIKFKNVSYPDEVSKFLKNENLLLHLPTNFWEILIDDKTLRPYSLKHWNESISDDVKNEIENFSNIIKTHDDDVFLINAFDYAFDGESIKQKFRNKLVDIHIFDENPLKEDAESIVGSDMGKRLLDFLVQIYTENSNIIFAFNQSLLKSVESKINNMSTKAIESLIYLALDYNGRI